MSMSDSIVLDIRDLKSHFFTAKGGNFGGRRCQY